jgi:phosphate-selective porin OprO/OprP
VAASYLITGEDNSPRGITPKHPFTLREPGWGAWEIAARYSQLEVDDDAFPTFANPATSASKASSWTVGVNWHLNKNFKLQLNYEQTDFGGGTSELLQKGEKAILTRAQISF